MHIDIHPNIPYNHISKKKKNSSAIKEDWLDYLTEG